MPTYEYGCQACGREWEEIQRITEPPIEVCPSCGKAAAHRLISAGTNFILKGGGWYSDLYSSSKGGAPKAQAGTTPAATASSETKSSDAAAPAPATTPPATSSSS